MTKTDSVLKSVLGKITPSEKETRELQSVVDRVKGATRDAIKPFGYSFVLAGSFSRNTWLSHKKEFDIFILLPESLMKEDLEQKGLSLGKKIATKMKGKYEIAYAEHPYVRAKIEGFDVDIVPAYKIASAEKIKSAVDRTPFHNKYLDKHLGNSASEVRLLKKFCKSIGVYGSDLKTQGFSGYLCELLVIRYRSFETLAKQAAEWKPGKTFIDIENINKGNDFNHPLVVIDPVDPKRNVAAALSPSNFVKFTKSCSEFVRKPSESIFFRKEPKHNRQKLSKHMSSRGTKFLLVEFQKPKIVEDIIYPQLRKTAKRIAAIFAEYEFSCMGQDVFVNSKKCYMLFEMEVWSLPKIRKVVGPPVFSHKNAEDFIKKYKPIGRVFIEDDRWVAMVKRKFLAADEKLSDTLSDKLVDLKSKGIASYIAEFLVKGFKIYKDKSTLRPGLEIFIHNYMDEQIE